jgi:hypothetical protein
MRSRAQPKFACGVFGSKGSVYNDCEKVVNIFSDKSHRNLRMVLKEQKQLAAEGFLEPVECTVDGGEVSRIKNHGCAAILKFG